MVQQTGMGRQGALETKIIRRVHNPLPKDHLPETVDGHPGSQRVIGMGQPLAETQAVHRPVVVNRQDSRGWPRLNRPVLVGITVQPPLQNVRRPGRGKFFHDHQVEPRIQELVQGEPRSGQLVTGGLTVLCMTVQVIGKEFIIVTRLRIGRMERADLQRIQGGIEHRYIIENGRG